MRLISRLKLALFTLVGGPVFWLLLNAAFSLTGAGLYYGSSRLPGLLYIGLLGALAGAVAGTVVGLGQSRAARLPRRRALPWVAASIVGWLCAGGIFGVVNWLLLHPANDGSDGYPNVLVIAAGTAAGTCTALGHLLTSALRYRMALRTAVVTGVSWSLGWLAGYAFLWSVSGGIFAPSFFGMLVAWVIAGSVAGVINTSILETENGANKEIRTSGALS